MLKLILVPVLVGGLTACASADPEVALVASPDGGSIPAEAGLGDAGCTAGQTAACTCPANDAGVGAAGVQQCFQGAWLLCNCQPPPTVQVSLAGECLAGLYEGEFEGEYRSGYQFGGSLAVSGALNLTLTQNKEGEGEFAIYKITAGEVTGKANDRFPFNGTLTGELDCTTKKFVGVLEGCYQVVQDLAGLAEGCFKGPMNGVYDAKNKSFVSGTWDVLEPDTVLFQKLGGNGTWSAPYTGPASADAGTPDAGTLDAGPADAGLVDAGAIDGATPDAAP